MQNNDVAAVEERFSLLLEAFDEALAEGRSPPEISADLPEAFRTRLARAHACLEALQQRADAEPAAGELEAWLRSREAATSPPPGGLQLGRFRVLRELGRGGSGIVFLARDLRLSRQIALKVPLPEVLFTPELRRRFLKQASAAACLDHPNLVPIHDADEEGLLCYIVSTYCPGPTLAAWLRDRRGAVPVDVAARLVAALADAVAYVHSKGIIHRDIKPGNVLLEPKQEVTVGVRGGVKDELQMVPRLTDFGLAKVWEGGDGLTKTGAVLGTAAYMAPEQAQGRKDTGPSADVYALGVVLYEVLAGQAPFLGESDADTRKQVVEAEPVSPRRLRPAVPRDLETICLKCLEKNPASRYASAGALAEDLRHFLKHEPIEARRPRWGERLLKWVRRKPAVAALVVVSGFALIGLLAGSLWYGVRMAEHNADLQAALDREREARDAVDQASSQIYLRMMQRAHSLWELGQASVLIELLETERPVPGEGRDYRGFEWHYLWHLTHPPAEALPGSRTHTNALALSPDGKILAAGKANGVWLWELTEQGSWRGPTRTLAHEFGVSAVAFAPDGKTLAAGGGVRHQAGELKLWEVATGRLRADLKGTPSRVSSLSFSADGERLIALNPGDMEYGIRSELREWQVRTHRVAAVRPAHANAAGHYATSVAYSPDSRKVALTGTDGVLQVWDASRLAPESTDRLHNVGVLCLRYSPGGKWLATGAMDGQVIARSVAPGGTRTEVRRYEGGHSEVWSLAYCRDGKVLAAGFVDGTIRLWDADTGRPQKLLLAHPPSVGALVFTRDGTGLLSGGKDGALKRWDLRGARLPTELKGHRPEEAWSVAFSLDGKTLATGGDDHCVRLWDAATGEDQDVLKGHKALVACVAFSPDGRTLASGSFDQKIRLWDMTTRTPRATLEGHKQQVRGLAFSADGLSLASVSGTYIRDKQEGPGEVKLWDLTGGSRPMDLEGHGDRVYTVAFSPNCRLLASGSVDGKVLLWDRASGTLRQSLHVQEGVCSVAFSPDGRMLATFTGNAACVWEMLTRQQAFEARIPETYEMTRVAFAADGRLLALVPDDLVNAKPQIKDLFTGKVIGRLEVAEQTFSGFALAPDGLTLAGGLSDTSVLTWDVSERVARPPAAKLTADETRRLWAELAVEAPRAYPALRALCEADGQAVALLKGQLRPHPKDEYRDLLADLDARRFAVRDAAAKKLARLGRQVEPALRGRLRTATSLEARRRLERLLATIDQTPLPAEILRQVRAVQVLEQIASPESVALLRELATGAPDARLTEEARASLQRLARRDTTRGSGAARP